MDPFEVFPSTTPTDLLVRLHTSLFPFNCHLETPALAETRLWGCKSGKDIKEVVGLFGLADKWATLIPGNLGELPFKDMINQSKQHYWNTLMHQTLPLESSDMAISRRKPMILSIKDRSCYWRFSRIASSSHLLVSMYWPMFALLSSIYRLSQFQVPPFLKKTS